MSDSTKKVVIAIVNNPKRMAKLKALTPMPERFKKAKAFVVAECAAQKLKLPGSEVSRAALALIN